MYRLACDSVVGAVSQPRQYICNSVALRKALPRQSRLGNRSHYRYYSINNRYEPEKQNPAEAKAPDRTLG